MNNKMYYQWKAEGICVLCGKKPAVPGMIYCATCREKELKRKRENWAASKEYREALEEKQMTYSERIRKYARKDNYKTALIIAEMMKDAPSTGVVYYLEQKLGETE